MRPRIHLCDDFNTVLGMPRIILQSFHVLKKGIIFFTSCQDVCQVFD